MHLKTSFLLSFLIQNNFFLQLFVSHRESYVGQLYQKTNGMLGLKVLKYYSK
jgi:hypothetical protein